MTSDIRYYRKTFPFPNDILIAKITEIADTGVYAKCVDYPTLKLFICPTEISYRKVNLRQFFSPEKLYPVRTLNVYKDTNIVDVSYSKITEKDRNDHLEKFAIYQKIYKLGLEASDFYSSFAERDQDYSTNYIFDKTVWPIFDKFWTDKCTTIYINDFYTSVLEDPSKFFADSSSDNTLDELNSDYKEKFVQNIRKKIKISDVVLTTEIILICLEGNAIERIKNTLNIDNPKVQIRYTSPRYELIVCMDNKTNAEQLMEHSISTIKENCDKFNVNFVKHTDICVKKDKQWIYQ